MHDKIHLPLPVVLAVTATRLLSPSDRLRLFQVILLQQSIANSVLVHTETCAEGAKQINCF